MASNLSLHGTGQLRKFELQSMLSQLNLPVYGTKAELIQRINRYSTKCQIDYQIKTTELEISKIELEMSRLHSIVKPTTNMTSTPQHVAQNKPSIVVARKLEKPLVKSLPQSTYSNTTDIPMEMTLTDKSLIDKPKPVPRERAYNSIVNNENLDYENNMTSISMKSTNTDQVIINKSKPVPRPRACSSMSGYVTPRKVTPKPAPRHSSELHLNYTSSQTVSDHNQSNQEHILGSPTYEQNTVTANSNTQFNDMIRALTQSLAVSKLPTPEPPVFMGDTMKYNDWKKAFKTMIVDKGLSDSDNLFYLQSYVS